MQVVSKMPVCPEKESKAQVSTCVVSTRFADNGFVVQDPSVSIGLALLCCTKRTLFWKNMHWLTRLLLPRLKSWTPTSIKTRICDIFCAEFSTPLKGASIAIQHSRGYIIIQQGLKWIGGMWRTPYEQQHCLLQKKIR